jgi:cobyrinic acid a,c-diamide synthase
VKELFARKAADADIAVIEGVMGLFDGADPAGLSGSTAEVAGWLDAPVLLVTNAHGAGRSFAAMVRGFAGFEPSISVAGVIANRCGSERHVEGLRMSLEAAGLPDLLGSVRRDSLPPLASRHLGLLAAEASAGEALGALADAIEAALDLDAIVALAGRAGEVASPEQAPSTPVRVRLGVALDEAFSFYYPDNLEALKRAGCEMVFFSPLRDSALPDALDGIYLGGGYPEAHAATLAENHGMIAAIRSFAAGGGTIYAECGGLMYLSDGITTLDGAAHPMLGLLSAPTRMCPARKSLGYVEVTTTLDSVWGPPGTVLRGHEFHYSELAAEPSCDRAYELRHRRGKHAAVEGYQTRNILASYVHLHFASAPGSTDNLVRFLIQHRTP